MPLLKKPDLDPAGVRSFRPIIEPTRRIQAVGAASRQTADGVSERYRPVPVATVSASRQPLDRDDAAEGPQ
jgi:hypothetical protein